MTLVALALLTTLHGTALGAAPLAAHARIRYPDVQLARLVQPARLRLLSDEQRPLVSCALRLCSPTRSEPLHYRPPGYGYDRPEEMVVAFTSRFTHDPLVTAAAVWLTTDRVRLDVRGNRFFVSLRLPTP